MTTEDGNCSNLFDQRRDALKQLSTPLPGSQPYLNRRPLNVPARFAGYSLLDFLCGWHPQVPREVWLQRIDDQQIVRAAPPGSANAERRRRSKGPRAISLESLTADCRVRAGECFEHLLPQTIEPDVNPLISFLYEDQNLVVVSKPAPLPIHPSGRFNRNTLQHLLELIYTPERLRFIHRLDANTSGVLLLGRNHAATQFLQARLQDHT
ncbi:MAG: hypothetical protein KDA85_22845, partial [Planctomycetaceae bacterium]|nr:hypothetical protein [Planctomycetaceae bacterium]